MTHLQLIKFHVGQGDDGTIDGTHRLVNRERVRVDGNRGLGLRSGGEGEVITMTTKNVRFNADTEPFCDEYVCVMAVIVTIL